MIDAALELRFTLAVEVQRRSSGIAQRAARIGPPVSV
jgi:hypothetical protein